MVFGFPGGRAAATVTDHPKQRVRECRAAAGRDGARIRWIRWGWRFPWGFPMG